EYLVARPFTVDTRLSLASRPAPTGTSTARSASTCAWAARVFGCAVAAARAAVRRVLAEVRFGVRRVAAELRLLRDAVPVVLRRVVRLVAGFCGPEGVVAMLYLS